MQLLLHILCCIYSLVGWFKRLDTFKSQHMRIIRDFIKDGNVAWMTLKRKFLG